MSWLVPLFITFAAALFVVKYADESPGMYGGGALFNLVVFFAGLVVAMSAWLAWFVWAMLT